MADTQEFKCEDCGREYEDWTLLPHELFNKTCPNGRGLICFDCFIKRKTHQESESVSSLRTNKDYTKDTQEFLDETIKLLQTETLEPVKKQILQTISADTATGLGLQAREKAKQAILQHFQQEHERKPEVAELHDKLDELVDLYGEVVIMSQKDWDRNLSNNYVLKSEVDRLIAETRLNLIEYFDQCSGNEKMNWEGLFEDTRKLVQSELDQLSKDKEGSK